MQSIAHRKNNASHISNYLEEKNFEVKTSKQRKRENFNS